MDDDEFEAELRRHDLRADASEADYDPDGGSWGWSPGRIASIVALIAMIGFWVWAFSPLAPRGHPDELDSRTFPEFAEPRCVAALEEIDQVEPAKEASDLLDRAAQIETATDVLVLMVADLEASAPQVGTHDGDLVDRWLSDWRIYLEDRYRYAANFRDGIDQAFQVTAIDGDQVTSPLDLFAEVNGMGSCVSPSDV